MRIESLTFFRFIAALMVVIFYFGMGKWFTESFGRFVVAGSEIVFFFFVLSGFIMLVYQIIKEKFSTKKHYYDRIARILPVYLIEKPSQKFLLKNYSRIINSITKINS